MPHLEEGTIHELLDGELSGAEAAEIASHVESCAECAARLAEARVFMAEADRLIAGLDAPAAAPAAAPPLPDLEIPTERTDRRVLMPAPPSRGWRRRAQPLRWAWAAMLAVVAGGGYLILGSRGAEDTVASAAAPADTPALPPAPGTVAFGGAADAERADESDTADRGAGADTQRVAQAGEPAEPADAPVAAKTTELADARAATGSARRGREETAADRATNDPGTERREAERVDLAARTRPAAPPAAASARVAGSTSPAPLAGSSGAQSAAANRQLSEIAAMEPGVVRSQAPERLQERSRPGDSLLVATAPSVPVAAAPPRPSIDLMAQSQIALRIGLDEAKRELGGNLHVIDGLQPEFVGLVPGRLVPGADTGAYVVRVVYLDDEQRTIFLDQQRIRRRPGSEGPVARLESREDAGRSQWTAGNVRLSLKGSLPRDSLAKLARKVR